MNLAEICKNFNYQRDKPYELWFREQYLEQIKEKKLKTAVRPGNRTYPNPKWVNKEEIVKIRILKKNGNDLLNIAPEFNGYETRAVITNLEVKTIQEVNNTDLVNCSSDCLTLKDMKEHLKNIYGREFNDNEQVTILKFDYLD